ncbi:hypothetical protein [Marinactinospora rubrisoli]|uniref:Uncharacterized protein n=1 Tax=Marinactinospora rubrisoli TaxID=2715399 RepID=A0ABW2KHI2_9ACTN
MRIVPRDRVIGAAAPALLGAALLPWAPADAEAGDGTVPDRPPTTAVSGGPEVHSTGADPGEVAAYWTDARTSAAQPMPLTRS